MNNAKSIARLNLIKRSIKDLQIVLQSKSIVQCCSFSDSGNIIVYGSGDGVTKVYKIDEGKHIAYFKTDRLSIVSCSISPNNRRVVTGNEIGILKIWDINTGKCRKTLTKDQKGIISCSFTPRGDIISKSNDGTIKLWDISGKLLRILNRATIQSWDQPSFPEYDGVRYIMTGAGNRAIVWSIRDLKFIGHRSFSSSNILWLSTSSNGRLCACIHTDGMTIVWNIYDGKMITHFHHDSNSCVFTPDNNFLITNSPRNVKMWCVKTGKCIMNIRDDSLIEVMSFSKCGRYVAIRCRDMTLRIKSSFYFDPEFIINDHE